MMTGCHKIVLFSMVLSLGLLVTATEISSAVDAPRDRPKAERPSRSPVTDLLKQRPGTSGPGAAPNKSPPVTAQPNQGKHPAEASWGENQAGEPLMPPMITMMDYLVREVEPTGQLDKENLRRFAGIAARHDALYFQVLAYYDEVGATRQTVEALGKMYPVGLELLVQSEYQSASLDVQFAFYRGIAAAEALAYALGRDFRAFIQVGSIHVRVVKLEDNANKLRAVSIRAFTVKWLQSR